MSEAERREISPNRTVSVRGGSVRLAQDQLCSLRHNPAHSWLWGARGQRRGDFPPLPIHDVVKEHGFHPI